jgi:phage tail protein X
MKTYTTIQGQCWDQIAKKLYGRETALGALVAANPERRAVTVFAAGVVLRCPDLPYRQADRPKWQER